MLSLPPIVRHPRHWAVIAYIAPVILLLLFGSLAHAQQIAEHPPACDEYARIQVPAADLPTLKDRKALGSCQSESLYFGFDSPVDAVAARKCAYIERETGENAPETVFGAAGLLTMVYANGKGAPRNFNLALKFACEIDGAAAENYHRVEHLSQLKKQQWNGDNFSLCDDATSGFMDGACAALNEKFDQTTRAEQLKKITQDWSSAEKCAFQELEQAANAFFEASSQNEVDLSGTSRAAFEIDAQANLNNDFVNAVKQFEEGQLPKSTPADFSRVDAQLNSIYAKIQSGGTQFMGTITPQGIRTAQRLWLRYREAWVRFGEVKYPNVSPESWRVWLTRARIKVLQNFV